MEPLSRRMRVHLAPESTFLIETHRGVVTRCTRQRCGRPPFAPCVVGRSERDVAAWLMAAGALFVDLVLDRTQMRYVPRDRDVYRPTQSGSDRPDRSRWKKKAKPEPVKAEAAPAGPSFKDVVSGKWKPSEAEMKEVPF